MSTRDVIDKVRARQFAWRVLAPGETIELSLDEPAHPPTAPVEEPVPDSGRGVDLEELRAEAGEACRAIADEVDRVWTMVDPALQAAATASLARKADKLGLSLAAIQAHPLQSVRLARLFVRHYPRFSRSAKTQARNACLWMSFEHPETAGLILELARSGNVLLANAIAMSSEEDGFDLHRRDLALHLALILDEETSWASRTIALDWLAVAGPEFVVPALRRAVRLPNIAVRSRALALLLELPALSIEAEDVLFLLQDGVVNPPPDDTADDDDDARDYADALLEATIRMRPAGGEEALFAMVDDDESFDRGPLDSEWALEALAAAYPDEALPILDYMMDSASARERGSALAAVARLPREHMRPRLLLAAADGAPQVAERARAVWLEREAEQCPVPETAGLFLELLDAPPSERMLSRLVVLRGRSGEARDGMVEVLRREAPDREALVLLLFALADDDLLLGGVRDITEGKKRWGKFLVTRFGPPAVRGLCALAARYPNATFQGWFAALRELVADGTIRKRDLVPVRDVAARQLDPERWDGEADPVRLLAAAGAAPEHLERVWAIAIDDDDEGLASMEARSILEKWKDDGALDARLAASMSAALAANDFERLGRATQLAMRRRAPACLDVAERMIAAVDDEDAHDVLVMCAHALVETGRLGDAWILAALDDPSSILFAVAACLKATRTVAGARARLEASLTSSARDGVSAAEAATALLYFEPPMKARDPRIAEVVRRAPAVERASLIGQLAYAKKAPFSMFEPHLTELFASDDPRVVDQLSGLVYMMRSQRAFFRRILPTIVDPALRAEIEAELGGDAVDGRVWQRDPKRRR